MAQSVRQSEVAYQLASPDFVVRNDMPCGSTIGPILASGTGIRTVDIVIIEYMMKISKKTCILKLKRRNIKIIVLTSYTPYPSRKIRRICACTSAKTTKEQGSIRQEYSEEEVEETVTETMEQYMSKTRADYGSGVSRPKIKDNDSFELKSQFLKELRDNTFSGSDHEDANEHIEKMQEIVLFYNRLDVLTRQILDSRGAIPSKIVAVAKIAIQEMAEYSQKWHNGTSRTRSTKTSDGLEAIPVQLNNLGREIKKVNEKVYYALVGC
ncbi:transposase, Ptta/En/Spm, transposase, Tnp1/En/Spm-like protein, partial [Tanacetum coccineum]